MNTEEAQREAYKAAMTMTTPEAQREAFKLAMKDQLDKERKIYEKLVGIADTNETIDIDEIKKGITTMQN